MVEKTVMTFPYIVCYDKYSVHTHETSLKQNVHNNNN